jgi:hypothetical protein
VIILIGVTEILDIRTSDRARNMENKTNQELRGLHKDLDIATDIKKKRFE